MSSHVSKGEAFAALHKRPGVFVMPNPWDAGSARLMASFGFRALGTTSLGLSLKLGRNAVTTQDILSDAREIDAATPLPVSVDLENGGHADPERACEAYLHAVRLGLAGASIEDASGNPEEPIYPFDLAVARVAAVAKVVRGTGQPFVLTARADGLIHGQSDVDEIIRRLNAFADAGADVLYAPGLREPESVERIVWSVSRPVNVVTTHTRPDLTVADLHRMGVKRISVGGSLARHALGAAFEATRKLADEGTFEFVGTAPPSREFYSLFSLGATPQEPFK